MSHMHCPGSRRGHTWREIPGSRGADLAKRICIKCAAPGMVDSQGCIKLVLIAALLSACAPEPLTIITLPVNPDSSIAPTRVGQAVLTDMPNNDVVFTTSLAAKGQRSRVTGIVIDLAAGQATAQGDGTIELDGLVAGAPYYLSETTPGLIVPIVQEHVVMRIGVARSTQALDLDIQAPAPEMP